MRAIESNVRVMREQSENNVEAMQSTFVSKKNQLTERIFPSLAKGQPDLLFMLQVKHVVKNLPSFVVETLCNWFHGRVVLWLTQCMVLTALVKKLKFKQE